MMEIVVKSTLAKNGALVKLQENTQQKYKELVDPSRNKDLKGLEKNLTKTLNYYVYDSEVNIQWIEEPGVQINAPRAYVMLKEGGYQNTVDRCGHGLQRAYVLALFQQLAYIQASATVEEEKTTKLNQLSLPSLIIGIEEPELYQHPDRQRHFAKTLLELSSRGTGGAFENIQTVYSTHSPLLIDFQRFNQLRIFRKIEALEDDEPTQTDVTYTNLAEISRFVEHVKEVPPNTITDEALRQRLVRLMNPWMNEGFFAKLGVLVEGIKDRALILGEALSRDFDFESMGICIIPCSGKNSMTEIIAIYKKLEIPTYVVWDSDEGKPKGVPANRNILRCHDCEPEDYPCEVTDDFCCSKTNLERTFQNQIGEANYSKIIQSYCEEKNLENLAMQSKILILYLNF